MQGVSELRENILPKLREEKFDKDLINSGLLQKEEELFAYMTGDRSLPYRMQDSYTRDKKAMELEVVELENEVVKVVILPHQGGRVWSMYNKVKEKEILFCNPVFQPGNLAVRNAWLSGGIEWNLGQYGHSSLTMEDVYVGICRAEDGREFVRIYEYERIKGLFLHVDLHLLPGDENLYAHVTIHNTHKEDRSLYWWTNIAVELNRNCRVLSGTKEVVATTPIQGVNTFAHDQMPYLKSMPDKDASYPLNFAFASEYFFQNEADMKATWEVAAYNDDTAFFERSTEELPYKKMFCWSNDQGGDHWQHYLATEEAPLYVELQAGVCPTQVHGGVIKAESTVSFTQAFGDLQIDSKQAQDSTYEDSADYCYNVLEAHLSREALKSYDEEFKKASNNPVNELLFQGGGFALLEDLRVPGFIPEGMKFAWSTEDGSSQWQALLTEGCVPEFNNGYAKSYLTDEIWLPYLEKAAEKTLTGKFYYGIALYENGYTDKAMDALEEYATKSGMSIGYRTLAHLYARKGDTEHALKWYDKVFASNQDLTSDYYEEYIKYLSSIEKYEAAWNLYYNASEEVKADGNVRLSVLGAAVECGALDFARPMFEVEHASVREGEVLLNKYWYKMKTLEFVQAGMSMDEAKAKAESLELPYIVDFQMN